MRDLDFTPRWYTEVQLRRSARRRRLGIMVLLGLALLGWLGITEVRIQIARRMLATLQDLQREQSQEVEEVRNVEARLAELDAARARYRLVTGGVRMSQVLAEISSRAPAALVLNGLSIAQPQRLVEPSDATGDPPPSQPEPQPLNTTLNGYAAQELAVGQFLRELSDGQVFEDVQLAYSRAGAVADQELREFEVRCRLPNFE